MKLNISVQYQGQESVLDKRIEEIKKVLKDEGVFVKDIKTFDVYAVPEENKLYYVINGKTEGSVDLF